MADVFYDREFAIGLVFLQLGLSLIAGEIVMGVITFNHLSLQHLG
jgi:hypothetical protein